MSNKLVMISEGIAGAVSIGFTILLSPLLRPWYRRWGATDAEVRAARPGDAVVPEPKSEINGAITIHAPAEKIWPWFVQLGCQRGGWYSYDLLDNGGSPSAERILPEYQKLEVGDIVKAVPNGSFGFPVDSIIPNRSLSLAGRLNTANGQPAGLDDPSVQHYFAGDQTFCLDPVDAHTTRLCFRMRMDWDASGMNNFIYRSIVEPISFNMGRKMLKNIRRRAEAG